MTDDALCLKVYKENRHHLSSFAESVRNFFAHHPELNRDGAPVLHSIRMRLKSESSLADKLARKREDAEPIQPDELLKRVNDLAGIRLLHLYQAQFPLIHDVIDSQVKRGDWAMHESPIAYTWDPESRVFFEGFGLQTKVKESFYTSIHYVLKPRTDSPICCELQVRTLFEEIWGEIDHQINYPHPVDDTSCREQLRVLSRLVGAGTRLADSIFRAHTVCSNRSAGKVS
ncbi:MAG: RelA/SpoT domain-containing protein [Myxococcota bacterium]